MGSYIEKLKSIAKENGFSTLLTKEKSEKLEANNPSVVCSVTLGKELHAGHMFLVSIAEQLRAISGSKLPIMLINNNTGPRAAGALITVASERGLPLHEAAVLMNGGDLSVGEIVAAYRSRNEESALMEEAMDILNAGDYDIFTTISRETEAFLNSIGFSVQIVSESFLVKASQERIDALNPSWTGSGFMPFTDKKRLVVLQKKGALTATGTLLSSVITLQERLNSDLVILVDSMGDSQDASFVFSQTSLIANSVQIAGAAIGFEGRLASGSKGEALTIQVIVNDFYKQRPNGNLRKAAQYFTLTRPVSFPGDSLDLAKSFYDFYDNQSFIEVIVKCNDEVDTFKATVNEKLQIMQSKIGNTSLASEKLATKLLEFLPQRAESLFQPNLVRDLSASKKVEPTPPDNLSVHLKEMGYRDGSTNLYEKGFRKLGLRKNYYFSYLAGLLTTMDNIDSLKMEDCNTIKQMVEICLERVGL